MERADFLIMTALEQELHAVLQKLPSPSSIAPNDQDPHVYYYSVLPITLPDGSEESYSIAVVSALGVGRMRASLTTSYAIRRWNPSTVLLVGIAGGIPDQVQLGDILISDQIVDYEPQKLTQDGLLYHFDILKASPILLSAIRNYREGSWKDLLEHPELCQKDLRLHFGAIAAGNTVFELKSTFEDLRRVLPKLIGVEMEASGVVSIISRGADFQPGFLMIRSVSDLIGSSGKHDDWVDYASDIAASYTVGFLKSRPVPSLREKSERALLTLRLERDFQRFSKTEQEQLIFALANLLDINADQIRIIEISSGSVVMIIELSSEKAALRLVSMLLREDPSLGSLNIRKLELDARQISQYPVNSKTPKGSVRHLRMNEPFDIGIVIALKEEFREIFPQITAKSIFNDEINQYYYLFEQKDSEQNTYHCVVTFVGGMGLARAALVGDRLIHQFRPATIINIGIAGSMDSEAFVGDVIVAEQVDDYLYSGKVVDSKDESQFDFQLSGDPYKSSPDYVSHATHLEFAYPVHTRDWANCCQQRLEELIDEIVRSELVSKNLIEESPQILTGNIASGPLVVGTSVFVEWLKQRHDRKYLAVEMEAAGIMSAAHTRSTSTLVVRGISDYSDDRKKNLDRIGKGALRRYAMSNALALLWTLIDLQLLKRYGSEREHE